MPEYMIRLTAPERDALITALNDYSTKMQNVANDWVNSGHPDGERQGAIRWREATTADTLARRVEDIA